MGAPSEPPVRERILDAALSLLRDADAKKLAQPQVARLAGVPQGHLTYYFPRKLDLLAAVGRRFAELMRQDLVPFLGSGTWKDKDEQARRRVVAFASALIADRERTRMLLRLLVEADGDPELRDAMAEGAGFVRSLVAEMTGLPAGDPDVDLALAAFWGLAVQHLFFERGEEETDALVGRLREWLDCARDTPQDR